MFRAFFFRRPATLESAATYSLPRGGGLGRGHSPNCSNLPQYPNRPNTSLAACYPLSNSLPRGERTGWLLGIRGSARKQVEQATFCFSDDLQSTAANLSCLSNRLQPQNPLQPAPSPVGEGWGEGILQIAAIFSNALTAPSTSLAACCPLSSSLPRERGRAAVGVKVLQGNGLCRLLFAFQTAFINAQFSRLAPYNSQKSNQNQPSATVQAAFPILATRAGFPPVHRLFAAKFRGSKNAAR